MQSIKNPPQKMTQRFCLRWNNHQSNLLSVFDQLLHAETFTDVTLAVEGQYLKAHKMVLSACSPYFNALFVNHPEKHPIVILKDVPYADMKSLLDFMYRGEVSVDQERLTAFLRVAETLRIKGLTEVNDDKPTGPASPPPPPQLHRIQPYLAQQRKSQQAMMSSPLLGSALSMPKRKRGRPRKLSGSSNGTGNDFDDYDRENLIQGSPEMLEVKMGTEGYSGNEGSDDNQRESGDNDNEQDSNQERMDTSENVNKSQSKESRKDNENSTSDHDPNDTDSDDDQMDAGYMEPQLMLDEYDEPVEFKYDPNADSTTSQDALSQPSLTSTPNQSKGPRQRKTGPGSVTILNTSSGAGDIVNNSPELTQRLLGISIKSDLDTKKLMINQLATSSANTSVSYSNNSILQQQLRNDSLNNNNNTNDVSITTANNLHQQYLIQMTNAGSSSMNSSSPDYYKTIQHIKSDPGEMTANDPTSPTSSHFSRQPQRRRVRRKATSTLDDQAEHLTEMSVRGLDLFRYASITEGIYQCTECAKENVQKTFKNKYSFQRHAFLYHEGKHRKVFPCPVCGKEFSRPDKMKNHMKTTHECFIPKEINYHHPLNYLITAAAAGDIPQLFTQIENSSPSANDNQRPGYESASISPQVTITENTTPTNQSSSGGGDNQENEDGREKRSHCITIVKDEILEHPLLPISISEPSITIMEAEEVK